MDIKFCNDLQAQILAAIELGKRGFVYWGFNQNCIKVLSELKQLGLLESYTSGVIDPSPEKQGKKICGYEVLSPEKAVSLNIDVLVITENANKETSLREFSKVDSRLPTVIISGVEHIAFREPTFDELFSSCLVKSYATGYPNSRIHIYQSIKYLAESGIKGSVAEFGIFKGGTIVFIAKILAHFGLDDVKIYGFDIFEGFPSSRTIFDLYTNPECEFQDFEAVSRYCKDYGIEVIKGDICETYKVLEGVPLMFSFFDTDNYSPVRSALELCFEQTVKGGVLAFDHYTTEEPFIYTIGERMAAQEILKDKKVFHLHDTGIFVKL
jgi:O-methyltransferase